MQYDEIKRGQMWWWAPSERQPEHIQEGQRPVIIVSNDSANEYSKIVTIIPCTTSNKGYYPQQTTVYTHKRPTVILAEQIRAVPKYELVNYKCTLDKEQMELVDNAILNQLGIRKECCCGK